MRFLWQQLKTTNRLLLSPPLCNLTLGRSIYHPVLSKHVRCFGSWGEALGIFESEKERLERSIQILIGRKQWDQVFEAWKVAGSLHTISEDALLRTGTSLARMSLLDGKSVLPGEIVAHVSSMSYQPSTELLVYGWLGHQSQHASRNGYVDRRILPDAATCVAQWQVIENLPRDNIGGGIVIGELMQVVSDPEMVLKIESIQSLWGQPAFIEGICFSLAFRGNLSRGLAILQLLKSSSSSSHGSMLCPVTDWTEETCVSAFALLHHAVRSGSSPHAQLQSLKRSYDTIRRMTAQSYAAAPSIRVRTAQVWGAFLTQSPQRIRIALMKFMDCVDDHSLIVNPQQTAILYLSLASLPPTAATQDVREALHLLLEEQSHLVTSGSSASSGSSGSSASPASSRTLSKGIKVLQAGIPRLSTGTLARLRDLLSLQASATSPSLRGVQDDLWAATVIVTARRGNVKEALRILKLHSAAPSSPPSQSSLLLAELYLAMSRRGAPAEGLEALQAMETQWNVTLDEFALRRKRQATRSASGSPSNDPVQVQVA